MAEGKRRWALILGVCLLLLCLVILGFVTVAYVKHQLQIAQETAAKVDELEERVGELEKDQPAAKGGWGAFWTVLLVVLALVAAVLVVRWVAGRNNAMFRMKRDKLEKLVFEKAKLECPGLTGSLRVHKVESLTGYYGAKANYKWLVITFTTEMRSISRPVLSYPGKWSLFTYATSFKEPLEDLQGPTKQTADEMFETLRLSQYGHKGGGIFREPVKSELPLPDYIEAAVQKEVASNVASNISSG